MEPQPSPDGGRTWKYTLEDGITFEDGTPITSRDVKYGIERTFAQDVLEGGPAYLKDWLDNGQNYPGPYRDTTPDKLGLESVQTPDDKTLIFKLRSPFQDFPYVLAMPFASPVPRGRDTGTDYDRKPVSSGPYRIESYRPDRELVFARNDNWNRDTDGVRTALPDRAAAAGQAGRHRHPTAQRRAGRGHEPDRRRRRRTASVPCSPPAPSAPRRSRRRACSRRRWPGSASR